MIVDSILFRSILSLTIDIASSLFFSISVTVFLTARIHHDSKVSWTLTTFDLHSILSSTHKKESVTQTLVRNYLHFAFSSRENFELHIFLLLTVVFYVLTSAEQSNHSLPRTDVPASGSKRNRKERMPIPEPSDQFQTDPTRTQ
jgi:hypothetical protein